MNSMLSIASIAILAVIVASSVSLNAQARSADDARARKFIAEHEARIRPLEKAVNRAWWTANLSGKDEEFKAKEQTQNKLDEAFADKETFAELKAIKQLKLRDHLLARQIDVLYLMYLEKQVPADLLKRITSKANAIEQAFNVFRARVDNADRRRNRC